MDDAELLDAFAAGTVPKDEWTHRAHVRVATSASAPASGRCSRASGSRTRSSAATTRPSPWRGSASCAHGPYESFDLLLEGHGYLLDEHVLRVFYSRSRLVSARAKRSFVDGDLAPLP